MHPPAFGVCYLLRQKMLLNSEATNLRRQTLSYRRLKTSSRGRRLPRGPRSSLKKWRIGSETSERQRRRGILGILKKRPQLARGDTRVTWKWPKPLEVMASSRHLLFPLSLEGATSILSSLKYQRSSNALILLHIPDVFHFFYTDTFWILKILHTVCKIIHSV